MKLIHTISLAALTAACSSTGAGDTRDQGSDSPTSGELRSRAAEITTSADLPACNDTNDGALYYVSDEDVFEVCSNGAYHVIDLAGEDGADGEKGAD